VIEVTRNKRKVNQDFPIIIKLSIGELFFTERAARELRDKLSSVLADIKKEAER